MGCNLKGSEVVSAGLTQLLPVIDEVKASLPVW